MFSLGCIQSLQCHLDTCPTGITTHKKRFQKGLVVEDKAERVAKYAHWVNHEINVIAHSCGLRNASEFSRKHVRILQKPGYSISLDQLYPEPVPIQLDTSARTVDAIDSPDSKKKRA